MVPLAPASTRKPGKHHRLPPATGRLATGLPAQIGLTPMMVMKLVQELSSTIQIVGADVVEISPPLGRAPWADESISRVGADHLLTILNARN